MNAAIIIPTYNERDNLAGLVSAILQHAGYRIIVVDDDSPDGRARWPTISRPHIPARYL